MGNCNARTFDLVHSEEVWHVGVDGMVGEHPVLLLSLRHGPVQVIVHFDRVVLAFLQKRGPFEGYIFNAQYNAIPPFCPWP